MSVHPFVVLARDMASRTLRNIGQAADRLNSSFLASIPVFGAFYRAGSTVVDAALGAARALGQLARASAQVARDLAVDARAAVQAIISVARSVPEFARNAVDAIGGSVRATREFVGSLRDHVTRMGQAFRDASGHVVDLGRRIADIARAGHLGATAVTNLRNAVRRLSQEMTQGWSSIRQSWSSIRQSTTSAFRAVASWGKAAVSSLKDIASSAASAATGIAKSVSGFGLLFTAILSVLGVGADLARVLNVGFIAPAAITATVAVVGTLKLAMFGLADAWEAADAAASGSAEDLEAYQKALAKLSPAGREFITVLRGWKPVLDELSRTVQQSVFAGIASQLDGLARVYFPIFRTGLARIGSALNKAMQGVADFLKTPAAFDVVRRILDETAKATEVFGGALKSVVTAFFMIADVGSEFLPKIAGWVADIAKRFEDWVRHARETGQLKQWLQQAFDMLKDMGAIAWNVGRAFAAIGKAASDEDMGKSLLGTLKNLTDKWADWLESEEGQVKLRGLFGDIKQMLKDIGKFIGDLADPNSEFRTDLRETLDVLRDIRDMVQSVGDWLERVGGKIAAIKQGVVDVFSALATPINIGQGLLAGIESLPGRVAAGLAALPTVVANAFGLAWQAAVAGANKIVNDVAMTAGSLPSRVAAAIASLPTAIVQIVDVAWLGAKIATDRGVAGVAASSSMLPGTVRGAISTLPGALSGVSGNAWEMASSVFARGIAVVVGQASRLPGMVAGVLGGLGGLLVGAGRSLIQGLINGIDSMMGALRSKLNEVTSMIPNIKGPLSKDRVLLQPAGRAIMTGLMAGISQGVPDLRTQLAGITDSIPGLGVRAGAHAEARAIGATGGAVSKTYQITVNVPVGANPADIGATLVEYVKAYERDNGAIWRS